MNEDLKNDLMILAQTNKTSENDYDKAVAGILFNILSVNKIKDGEGLIILHKVCLETNTYILEHLK